MTKSISFAITVISLAAASVMADAPDIEGEEVFFDSGEIRLAGLWFRPEAEPPHPAAVIIRGSGYSSRDSYWARSIIDVLLSSGVAVLLPDKRGSDASGGDWRTVGFEVLADDAASAVRFVRARSDTDGDRIGLVGLSQGGKIAPVAAARTQDLAFIVNVVGSATTLAEQISWEMFHTFRESGLSGPALQQGLVLQVIAEKFVQGEVDWATYEAELARALDSDWSGIAQGFPASADAWQWRFFRQIHDFDPLPYWSRVEAPVLVFHGEDDHNAPSIRSAYRLTRTFLESGHPDWRVHVIPDVGHGLWQPETRHDHHPKLHDEFVSVLSDWIKRVTR